jgi:hypothetical protein
MSGIRENFSNIQDVCFDFDLAGLREFISDVELVFLRSEYLRLGTSSSSQELSVLKTAFLGASGLRGPHLTCQDSATSSSKACSLYVHFSHTAYSSVAFHLSSRTCLECHCCPILRRLEDSQPAATTTFPSHAHDPPLYILIRSSKASRFHSLSNSKPSLPKPYTVLLATARVSEHPRPLRR